MWAHFITATVLLFIQIAAAGSLVTVFRLSNLRNVVGESSLDYLTHLFHTSLLPVPESTFPNFATCVFDYCCGTLHGHDSGLFGEYGPDPFTPPPSDPALAQASSVGVNGTLNGSPSSHSSSSSFSSASASSAHYCNRSTAVSPAQLCGILGPDVITLDLCQTGNPAAAISSAVTAVAGGAGGAGGAALSSSAAAAVASASAAAANSTATAAADNLFEEAVIQGLSAIAVPAGAFVLFLCVVQIVLQIVSCVKLCRAQRASCQDCAPRRTATSVFTPKAAKSWNMNPAKVGAHTLLLLEYLF